MYGRVEYDENDKPICDICGLSFNKLGSHVRQSHRMTAREYKELFGLDLIKGIMSPRSTALAKRKLQENYDQCVTSNLIQGGANTRFEVGSKGRTKDQVSEQTRLRLSHNKIQET